jgi:hypothetical protein
LQGERVMDMNYVKLHEKYEKKIKDLFSRVEILEKELESIKNQTIEDNLYNTTSTISQNTIDIDMDRDYGQQSF